MRRIFPVGYNVRDIAVTPRGNSGETADIQPYAPQDADSRELAGRFLGDGKANTRNRRNVGVRS